MWIMGGNVAYKNVGLANGGMKKLMIVVATLLLSVLLVGRAGAQTNTGCAELGCF
jgi:hypothetical protein